MAILWLEEVATDVGSEGGKILWESTTRKVLRLRAIEAARSEDGGRSGLDGLVIVLGRSFMCFVNGI